MRFTVHRLACDRCGAPLQTVTSVEELLEIAKAHGWELDREEDGQHFDLCPDCAGKKLPE